MLTPSIFFSGRGAPVISANVGNKSMLEDVYKRQDHADLKFQKKHLPIMKEAVRKELINASDYAVLTDRIRMKEGKPQKYYRSADYHHVPHLPEVHHRRRDCRCGEGIKGTIGALPQPPPRT